MMKLKVFGVVYDSLVDYPGELSTVFFLPHCNFNCIYCHNKDQMDKVKTITFNPNKTNNAIVLTGGEPTLHPLHIYCKEFKKYGKLVKVDTNGSNYLLIKKLVKRKLVDYIALDVKTSPKNYRKVTGVNFDFKQIKKHLKLFEKQLVNYEIRITYSPDFISINDLLELRNILSPFGHRVYIQQYIGEQFKVPSYDELQMAANIISPNTKVRCYTQYKM